MTPTERQALITTLRNEVTNLTAAYVSLRTANQIITAQGGIAGLILETDLTGENAGMSPDDFTNWMSTNFPAIEAALFTGSAGGNGTNTSKLIKQTNL